LDNSFELFDKLADLVEDACGWYLIRIPGVFIVLALTKPEYVSCLVLYRLAKSIPAFRQDYVSVTSCEILTYPHYVMDGCLDSFYEAVPYENVVELRY